MPLRPAVDSHARASPDAVGAFWRISWTIATIVVVQTTVLAVALIPVVAIWALVLSLPIAPLMRVLTLVIAVGPAYAIFALTLMFASALVTAALGWRTPVDVEMRIRDVEWPLLGWVRYMAAIHVVRVLAGLMLRGTPVWTAYLRLNGATIGRRVYVNSLGLSDYNLLELSDDVVIGADVHIAGHTVERGVVKTARVKLGPGVTVGVGSIIDIGVTAGADCQIGALSLVPKYTALDADAVYVGVPVRRIDARDSDRGDRANGGSSA